MRRILIFAAAGLGLLLAGGAPSAQNGPAPGAAGGDAALEKLLAADCSDDAALAIARAAGRLPQEGGVASDDWPPQATGGVLPPIRSVSDPFPTFDGIALDTENNRLIFSDENRHSLLVYDRAAGGSSNEPTEPAQWMFGPKTQLGFVAGVEVDPRRKEFYTVNNDGGDSMVVFTYDDHGNVQARRTLILPHQSWDVALAPKRDEIAITVQQSNAISLFKRDAHGTDAPIRTIRGVKTGLEDPHGVYFDEQHNELITANHGNWTQLRRRRVRTGRVSPRVHHRPCGRCERRCAATAHDRGRSHRAELADGDRRRSDPQRDRGGQLRRFVGPYLPARRQGQREAGPRPAWAVDADRGARVSRDRYQERRVVGGQLRRSHRRRVPAYGQRQRQAEADPPKRPEGHADLRLHERVGRRVRFQARRHPRAELSQRTENLGVCKAGKRKRRAEAGD